MGQDDKSGSGPAVQRQNHIARFRARLLGFDHWQIEPFPPSDRIEVGDTTKDASMRVPIVRLRTSRLYTERQIAIWPFMGWQEAAGVALDSYRAGQIEGGVVTVSWR